MRTVPVWLAAAVMVPGLCATAAAPQAPRIDNVSILPDQGWGADPNVIWYDSFDGSGNLLARYLEYDSDGGDCVPVGYQALGGSGQSLRARWQPGEVGAGGVKKTFGRNPMDYRHMAVRPTEDFREVYWRVYVRHQPGWTGNPAKMSRAIAFAGSNWSEAMIAHVWGGNSLNLCTDPARGVDANSQIVTTHYNDFEHLTWLGYRHGTYQIFDAAESGRWVCVEARVRLNTPGQSDGVFTLYLDGQVQVSRSDLNWVYSWQDYGINAVFLENYWNNGSPVAQERYFDDFVISTSYIGPAKSPLRPVVTKTGFADDDAADAQSGWQLQAAGDLAGSDIVWDSGFITGAGDSVTLDAAGGIFQGSLTGQTMLAPQTLYALRARQRDSNGAWSAWSAWMTVLRTGPLLAGDTDLDGQVDFSDYQRLERSFGITAGATWDDGDFDRDGDVDFADYAALEANFGHTAPEPTALALLVLGGLALARRPRRNVTGRRT